MHRQGVSRRQLAKRLAANHPSTVETYRRAVNRYLQDEDPVLPRRSARYDIADALGVDRSSVPTDDDEEEDLQLALLLRACRARSQRKQLPPRLEDWLRWGIRNGVFKEYAREELAA